MTNFSAGNIPTLEALLERLDLFEARLRAVELLGPEAVSSIDNRVALRISTLEKALIDQSAIVTALSRRAIESEENFQRLISAVERLCERTEPAAPSRSAFDLPFETQLTEAFQRQPAPSPSQPDSGFGPRIVRPPLTHL